MEEKRESLISILKKSPFYFTLPFKIRSLLIKALIREHPSLLIEKEEDVEIIVGYECSLIENKLSDGIHTDGFSDGVYPVRKGGAF